jgi:hypothetical protein
MTRDPQAVYLGLVLLVGGTVVVMPVVLVAVAVDVVGEVAASPGPQGPGPRRETG